MNLWAVFQTMVPVGGPLSVGEVTAVDGITVTVTTLPGGTVMTATGAGRSLEIGQRWIIQDGVIIDEAPSGTVFTAEV